MLLAPCSLLLAPEVSIAERLLRPPSTRLSRFDEHADLVAFLSGFAVLAAGVILALGLIVLFINTSEPEI